MKKILLYLIITGLVLIMLTGCPAVLLSKLPSDIVITLGRFNPTVNLTLYGPVGGILSVPVTISDQSGITASGSYSVVFTLSSDNDLTTTGDNTELDTVTITAGSEQITDITIPGTVAAAVYTLFAAISGAGDTVVNNNTALATVDIGALNQPDLNISSLSTGNVSGSYLPEAVGTLIYKIQNMGYASIAAGTEFIIRFTIYLSVADVEVGTHTVTLQEPLHPQGFITGTADFLMPTLSVIASDNGETDTTFTSWTDTLTAEVDSGATITETNEANNTASVGIGSASVKPELAVTSVSIANDTDYIKTGDPVESTVTIQNSGTAVASGYSTELFVDIDDDGTNNAGDISLHTWTAPPSVPFDLIGSQNTIVLSVPMGVVYPAVSDGTHRVRAEITGLTEEWDDTNNISGNGQSAMPTFVTTAFDLEMYSMSTTLGTALDEAVGGSVPITYTIYNSGEDNITTAFDVHFYASVDSDLTPGADIDLGTDTVADTISGNGNTMITHTLTFPAGQAIGFYTIYWDLDDGAAIGELDEGNNTTTDPEECFVFFPVTDAASGIDANLLAYKPLGAASESTYIRGRFYSNDFSGGFGASYGYNNSMTDPGDFAFSDYNNVDGLTLTPGNTIGISFTGYNNTDYSNGDVPYSFRLVPDYVSSVPIMALPTALIIEDSFENNDTTGDAALLGGSNNPLTGFVNAYTYASNNDFYYFVMP
jgi:hypothetical protein